MNTQSCKTGDVVAGTEALPAVVSSLPPGWLSVRVDGEGGPPSLSFWSPREAPSGSWVPWRGRHLCLLAQACLLGLGPPLSPWCSAGQSKSGIGVEMARGWVWTVGVGKTLGEYPSPVPSTPESLFLFFNIYLCIWLHGSQFHLYPLSHQGSPQVRRMGPLIFVAACQLLVVACGIKFPDEGLNPGPLLWKHGVQQLDHQGSPQRTCG